MAALRGGTLPDSQKEIRRLHRAQDKQRTLSHAISYANT